MIISALQQSERSLNYDSATSSVVTRVSPESTVARGGDTLCNEQAKRWLLIERTHRICRGEPILRGTRISVANIVELHHLLGWSIEKIKEEYPHLNREQILAALEYYEENTREIDGYLQGEKETGSE